MGIARWTDFSVLELADKQNQGPSKFIQGKISIYIYILNMTKAMTLIEHVILLLYSGWAYHGALLPPI